MSSYVARACAALLLTTFAAGFVACGGNAPPPSPSSKDNLPQWADVFDGTLRILPVRFPWAENATTCCHWMVEAILPVRHSVSPTPSPIKTLRKGHETHGSETEHPRHLGRLSARELARS